MKCAHCHHENPEDAKFCIECASPMEFHCPNCGAITPASGNFCKECAYDIRKPKESPPIDLDQPQSYTPKFLADKILTSRSSIEGERKLVTVLFADVANYTSISEKLDPEEVHQIMDGCFNILMEEIHRYEGTINQFTGDGVMALFGAPVAHEDHAQRACYAALSIQRAMEEYGVKIKKDTGVKFKMRIGLNSGQVIVGSIGDDLRMDYTAVGDTTNLASRMESSARPGTIIVSKNTYSLARDFFEFKSLGEVAIKGKEETQEAYELIKTSEVETRIEAAVAKGLTKFVGRTKEMMALKEAFEKAQSGSGQVTGVVGEAGVGKSRLLIELRNILPEDEYSYLEGRCLHYGGSMPYLPVLDILRSYFEIKEGDREYILKKKMEEKVLKLGLKLETVLSPLQELFSLKVEDETYLKLEPKEKRDRTFEAIRDLLIRVSQEEPLVVAVEDLHWIDKSTEEFLDYLIGWLANTHILLIILYRPEYTHQWGSKTFYSKIGVDQLSTTTSAELVQAILGGSEVEPELEDLVLGRAGGNPFFVEELAQSLIENGSIQRKDNQYVLTREVSEIDVPDTIQGIIAARIDRVEESLKRIMQVASVIGREFAFRLLQSIMGMREDLKSHLLNLQGLEFIYEKSLFPELEYIFKHALIQEVAYNSLLLKRRMEIHEKIGNAIEEIYTERQEEFYEILAHHYGRAEINDKAIHYLTRAAERAKAIYANEEAIAFYEKATEQLSQLLRKIEEPHEKWNKIESQIRENLGDVLELIGKHYEAKMAYQGALSKVPEHDLMWQAHLHRKTGNVCREQRLYGEALQAYDQAETALGPEPTESAPKWWQTWLEIQNDRMWLHYWQAQFHQMAELAERVRPAVEQYGTLALRSRFFQGLTFMAQRRDRYVISVETMAHARASLAAIRESCNMSAIALATFTLGFSHLWRGDLDEAEEHLQAAVGISERIGDVVVQSRCLTYLTILCRKRGQIEEVQHYISRAMDVAKAGNMLEYISVAKANLSGVNLREGNLSDAQENGRIALEMWQKAPLVYPFQWTALWPLISVANTKNQFSEAVDYVRALIEPTQQRLPEAPTALLKKVIKTWEGGETEKTHTYLNQTIELAQELGWL